MDDSRIELLIRRFSKRHKKILKKGLKLYNKRYNLLNGASMSQREVKRLTVISIKKMLALKRSSYE